jgi:hypothetical protein
MKTIKCYQCKKEIIKSPDGCGIGYGIDKNKHKICYACCGENDKKELLKAKPGDKFTFYYSGGMVTNWPGSLKIKPYYTKENGHNWWNVKRIDLWFTLDGNKFWCKHLGSSHELITITRIKND